MSMIWLVVTMPPSLGMVREILGLSMLRAIQTGALVLDGLQLVLVLLLVWLVVSGWVGLVDSTAFVRVLV